jgi:excisionase family DNA binding protein
LRFKPSDGSTQTEKMKTLMTSEQLAERLHVGRVAVQRMAQQERIPAMRVGKQWLFDWNDVERVLVARGNKLQQKITR